MIIFCNNILYDPICIILCQDGYHISSMVILYIQAIYIESHIRIKQINQEINASQIQKQKKIGKGMTNKSISNSKTYTHHES